MDANLKFFSLHHSPIKQDRQPVFLLLSVPGRPWHTPLFLMLLLAAVLSPRSALALSNGGFLSGLINFDYSFSSYGYLPYGPGPGAIGGASDQWNSVSLTDSGSTTLRLSDGTSSAVMWNLTGGGGVSGYIGGAYGRLFDVNCSFYSASISGLTPNHAYNLYFYNTYWAEDIQVNGVDFNVPGIRYGSVDSLSPGSEYDVHTVVADANGTLVFNPISAQFGTPYVTSWQLTPVPEPSAAALVGVLLGVWGVRRLAARRP